MKKIDLTAGLVRTNSDKESLISRCLERIQKNEQLIEETKANEYLTEEQKQKRIQRIQEIIDDDKFTVYNMHDHLERVKSGLAKVYC